MSNTYSYGWATTKPLLFNDSERGQVFQLPAGEPCLLIESVDDAKRRGLLKDEQEIWAAKTNILRGYCLVLIKGKVRGLSQDDIARQQFGKSNTHPGIK